HPSHAVFAESLEFTKIAIVNGRTQGQHRIRFAKSQGTTVPAASCSNLVRPNLHACPCACAIGTRKWRAKANGPAHSTTDYSAYLRELQIQQRAKLLELACDVTDAYGAVVCWAVGVPLIDEFSSTDRKSISAVRISNLKSGT